MKQIDAMLEIVTEIAIPVGNSISRRIDPEVQDRFSMWVQSYIRNRTWSRGAIWDEIRGGRKRS